MSTTVLTGLRDYLYGTLSPANLIWLGTQLTEYGNRQKELQQPYTVEEIHEMIAQAQRESAAGLGQDSEEMFRELKEEFAREEQLEISEAV